jgi:serine/threonine-protein kinase
MGLIGHTLDGQFRVDEVIGEGGFSVVYKGHHLGLGEAIAIKCLKLEASLGSAMVESFVRRFRDESRILYRLSQGNLHIVRSIASGTTVAPQTASLIPYTVLEWLEGHSLAQELDRRRDAGMRGRTLEEVILLLDSAAMAVAHAHEAGVVHRDLNPGNIFLTQTREGMKTKVLDFGLAKVVSDHHLELGPRAVTFGKIRIFSPAYAAPEQFDDRIGKIAPWTDVYTFAIVLLETLCDEPPVSGEDLGVIVGKTLDPNHRPTPRALGLGPDRVPDAAEAVFARALPLDTRERFSDGGEMWGTLKAALRKPDPRPLPRPPNRKRRDTPTDLLIRPEDIASAGAPHTQRIPPAAGRVPSKPPTSTPHMAGSHAAAVFPRLDQTLRMDDSNVQAMARSYDRARTTPPMQMPHEASGSWQSAVVPPKRTSLWLVIVAVLVGAAVALGGLLLVARVLHVRFR